MIKFIIALAVFIAIIYTLSQLNKIRKTKHRVSDWNEGVDNSKYHECEYCGVWTSQPDEFCYMHPLRSDVCMEDDNGVPVEPVEIPKIPMELPVKPTPRVYVSGNTYPTRKRKHK